ncbi:phage holin family protein [Actinosynnema sp. NPDC047251]|uniref:phage holin family protein n=1 Tax=Saccharothrix espanaensis TaxID=103731 RepID=UPI0002EC6FB3|nr:phage holin family protein [Saccharothrix espanaensis]
MSETSTSDLVRDVTRQTSRLVREEIRLAVAEISEKGKHVGLGVGLMGAAGVLAWFGVGTVVAGLVLTLALVLPAWAAAFVVAALVFLVAGVLVLLGRKQVTEGTPPLPEEAIEGVKRDISTVTERAHR